MTGLVSFPSFHTAAGVLFIRYSKRLTLIWPLMVALNGVMIVATMVRGSHYFSDLIGGAAVAFVAIWISGRFARWQMGQSKAGD